MTIAERRILWALTAHGPQFNGSLAVHADLVWNSRVFSKMERAGLIAGHPFEITEAGRQALTVIT